MLERRSEELGKIVCGGHAFAIKEGGKFGGLSTILLVEENVFLKRIGIVGQKGNDNIFEMTEKLKDIERADREREKGLICCKNRRDSEENFRHFIFGYCRVWTSQRNGIVHQKDVHV